ncbi:MAG: thiamine pyrophosphate-binding protein, partial [Actinomycetota bacterium]
MKATGDAAATFCATIVDEWHCCGVNTAIVAPGSRSTPLAVALLRHPGIDVQIFHDERSASFAALGVGVALGVPAVLLCTSGTAATQFHAAVVEAHQSAVPMIVCTADRPPELHGIGAPQTIDQVHLFGTAVRKFIEALVPSSEDSHTWRSLAREAFEQTTGLLPGP